MASTLNSLFHEYVNHHNNHSEQFGPNTVVLMEVGSFFEIYGVNNNSTKETTTTTNTKMGCDVEKVCRILDIQCTRKNKSILENSPSNPLMAGFPSYVLQKYIDMLVDARYVVVLVTQVTPAPNPTRAVTEIISHCTSLSTKDQTISNFTMMIYIEIHKVRQHAYQRVVYRMVTMDLTRRSELYMSSGMFMSNRLNDMYEEIYQKAFRFAPKEILVSMVDTKENANAKAIEQTITDGGSHVEECTVMKNMISYLKLTACKDMSVKENWIKKDTILNLHERKALLEKVFPVKTMIDILDYLDMVYDEASQQSLCHFITYVHQYDHRYIEALTKPVWMCESDHLTMNMNIIQYLDIASDRKDDLLTLLNVCKTAMGRRRFRHTLLHPIKQNQRLQHRYDNIEKMIQAIQSTAPITDQTTISSCLDNIYDMDRLVCKIKMMKISPADIALLHGSLVHCLACSSLTDRAGLTMERDSETHVRICDQLRETIHLLESTVNVEMCACAKTSDWTQVTNDMQNVFQPGYHAELDDLFDQFAKAKYVFEHAIAQLNEISGPSTYFKLECTERDGYSIQITQNRWKKEISVSQAILSFVTFRGEACSCSVKSLETQPVGSSKTSLRVCHDIFSEANKSFHTIRDDIRSTMRDVFFTYVGTRLRSIMEPLTNISNYVAKIDVIFAGAYNAWKYKYIRPDVRERDQDSNTASIRVKGIRHPIIERVNGTTRYVSNDISLGGDDANGILLYGINSSGKSSFMKSVGINIIMAQSGMFVAADEFSFTPYDKLFSRINSGDDLYLGKSTFVNEILDLRQILNAADENTLVIGDEVCSGTETTSAVSIVSATLKHMSERRVQFIFATHLHELTNIPMVQTCERLNVMHMSMRLQENNAIVFERKLQMGQGLTCYGLEVCKGLDLTDGFLQDAESVKQHLLGIGSIQEKPKRSRYNKKRIVGNCSICLTNPSSEVHHILYQKDADEQGFHGPCHKNALHNLVSLCETCHDKIHSNKISIVGYEDTTQGVRIHVKHL
jgi:DNA mismatch repair protein MutS